MASFIGVKSLFYPVGLDCQTYPWWIAAAGVSRRVGTGNYSPAPLTEPYVRITHTAPWINRSEPQHQLG